VACRTAGLHLETIEVVGHFSPGVVVLVAEEWQGLDDWLERDDEGGLEILVKIHHISGEGHAWNSSLSSF